MLEFFDVHSWTDLFFGVQCVYVMGEENTGAAITITTLER